MHGWKQANRYWHSSPFHDTAGLPAQRPRYEILDHVGVVNINCCFSNALHSSIGRKNIKSRACSISDVQCPFSPVQISRRLLKIKQRYTYILQFILAILSDLHVRAGSRRPIRPFTFHSSQFTSQGHRELPFRKSKNSTAQSKNSRKFPLRKYPLNSPFVSVDLSKSSLMYQLLINPS